MAVLQNSKDIFIDETERKPNLYASNVLVGIVAVIALICIFNEVGLFQIDMRIVRICLFLSFVLFLFMQFIVHKTRMIIHPATKFTIMSMVLFLVLVLTTLLNIHAILAFVLPLLVACQYRSHMVSLMALLGSCACSMISPILSFLFRTWSLNFMTGYMQTFCRVTIDVTPGNTISTLESIGQITLYWSMPQTLIIAAFGVILYSTTKSGISSVNHQMQVADLSIDLNKQLDSIILMQEKVLCSMSDIIESRDIETGGHVRRTSEIVRLIMESMFNDPQSGVSEEFCREVIRSAPMHDLGKIAIPDAILRKPGKLTQEEFEIVKQHPLRSAEIIAQVLTGIEDESLLTTAINVAKFHHERVDGTGYPQQLKGNEIPLEARIMALADVYDALVSERCYKLPMGFEEAFETIENLMGSQFDPDLNKYFVACRSDIERFYLS